MGDKMVAGLVTAAVVAPLCVVCLGGPAILAAIGGWITGWFGGLGAIASTGLAIAAAAVAVSLVKRRSPRAAASAPETAARDRRPSLEATKWHKRSET